MTPLRRKAAAFLQIRQASPPERGKNGGDLDDPAPGMRPLRRATPGFGAPAFPSLDRGLDPGENGDRVDPTAAPDGHPPRVLTIVVGLRTQASPVMFISDCLSTMPMDPQANIA